LILNHVPFAKESHAEVLYLFLVICLEYNEVIKKKKSKVVKSQNQISKQTEVTQVPGKF